MTKSILFVAALALAPMAFANDPAETHGEKPAAHAEPTKKMAKKMDKKMKKGEKTEEKTETHETAPTGH